MVGCGQGTDFQKYEKYVRAIDLLPKKKIEQ